MKLPEDRGERMKVLALGAIGIAAVAYAVIQLVILPLLGGKQEHTERIDELSDELGLAEMEIAQMAKDSVANRETVSEIKEITDKYVLLPRLGNYRLGATESIEQHALAAGVELDAVREIGMSEIPKGTDDKFDHLLRAYTVRVTVHCPYTNLVGFLAGLEQSNPLLNIPDVTIAGQPQADPENHLVNFSVQWPVWADPNTPGELNDMLRGKADETTEAKTDAR